VPPPPGLADASQRRGTFQWSPRPSQRPSEAASHGEAPGGPVGGAASAAAAAAAVGVLATQRWQKKAQRRGTSRNYLGSGGKTAVLTREGDIDQLTPQAVMVPSRAPFLDDIRTGVPLVIPILRPPAAEERPAPPGASECVVVDCGSGSTRAVYFSQGAGPSGVSRRKSEWRGEKLTAALADEGRTRELARLLADKIPQGRVLVGATAGVRHGLETGLLRWRQVEFFAACLEELFGDRVRFTVLDGEEEARAEWEALNHLLGERRGSPGHVTGMLSGGGMSCQLAVRGHGSTSRPQALLSFKNFVLTPGGIVERADRGEVTGADLREELPRYEASTREALRGLPVQQEGVVALAEWVALYVAAAPTERDRTMSLGYERLLSYSEVAEALDEHLEQLLGRTSLSEPVPREVVVAMTYGTVIRAILRQIFGKGVSFYALEGVSWATGHYLLSSLAATPSAPSW